MKTIFLVLAILTALLLNATAAKAQTYCVRADATGTATGADWTNAYTKLPTTLVRGATYYLADGNYPNYDFATANSGSTLITIRKATSAAHGSDTGWQAAYGDGQAVFPGISFNTSNYVIDGGTRSGLRSGYGIKIKGGSGANTHCVYTRIGTPISNVTFRYLEVGGPSISATSADGFYLMHNGGPYVIEKCWVYNVGTPFQMRMITGYRIEGCWVGPNYPEKEGDHEEAISDAGGSSNVVIRNNVFQDIMNTGFIVVLGLDYIGGSSSNGYVVYQHRNWEISGNVFAYSVGSGYPGWGVGNGVIAVINSQQAADWKVFNNSIVNVPGWDAGFSLPGSGNVIRNNIWHNLGINPSNLPTSLSVSGGDYDWFFLNNGSTPPSEAHGIIGTADPFVDWRNGDFRLKVPIPGYNMGIVSTDSAGNVRTDWDRGAFEYVGGQTPIPTPTPTATPTPTPTPTVTPTPTPTPSPTPTPTPMPTPTPVPTPKPVVEMERRLNFSEAVFEDGHWMAVWTLILIETSTTITTGTVTIQ